MVHVLATWDTTRPCRLNADREMTSSWLLEMAASRSSLRTDVSLYDRPDGGLPGILMELVSQIPGTGRSLTHWGRPRWPRRLCDAVLESVYLIGRLVLNDLVC